MAGQFDAEVLNSIRSMQTATAGLTREVEATNASLRRMQHEAGGAHRHVEGIGHAMHGIGHGARFAGGEAGHLIGHLARMASFNPMMLATGAAFAFISEKVAGLIEHLMKANEEMEKTVAIGRGVGRTQSKLEHEALLKADVQGLRKRAFDETGNPYDGVPEDQRSDVSAAAGIAVQSGLAKTREEAIARIKKSGVLGTRRGAITGGVSRAGVPALATIGAGQEDMDPEEFMSRVRRAGGSRVGQAASIAETEQYYENGKSQRDADEMLARGAGFAGHPSSRAAIAANPEASAEVKRLTDAIEKLTDTVREQKGKEGWGFDTGPSKAERELEHLRSQYSTLMAQISAATR